MLESIVFELGESIVFDYLYGSFTRRGMCQIYNDFLIFILFSYKHRDHQFLNLIT